MGPVWANEKSIVRLKELVSLYYFFGGYIMKRISHIITLTLVCAFMLGNAEAALLPEGSRKRKSDAVLATRRAKPKKAKLSPEQRQELSDAIEAMYRDLPAPKYTDDGVPVAQRALVPVGRRDIVRVGATETKAPLAEDQYMLVDNDGRVEILSREDMVAFVTLAVRQPVRLAQQLLLKHVEEDSQGEMQEFVSANIRPAVIVTSVMETIAREHDRHITTQTLQTVVENAVTRMRLEFVQANVDMLSNYMDVKLLVAGIVAARELTGEERRAIRLEDDQKHALVMQQKRKDARAAAQNEIADRMASLRGTDPKRAMAQLEPVEPVAGAVGYKTPGLRVSENVTIEKPAPVVKPSLSQRAKAIATNTSLVGVAGFALASAYKCGSNIAQQCLHSPVDNDCPYSLVATVLMSAALAKCGSVLWNRCKRA